MQADLAALMALPAVSFDPCHMVTEVVPFFWTG
jgi:hypothetical protein